MSDFQPHPSSKFLSSTGEEFFNGFSFPFRAFYNVLRRRVEVVKKEFKSYFPKIQLNGDIDRLIRERSLLSVRRSGLMLGTMVAFDATASAVLGGAWIAFRHM